jgi:protein-L-isoaspartate(D-aspartate) O-methyltransferase
MSREKNDPAGLVAVRRAFAKHVMLASRLQDSRLQAALAKTPREAFFAPGPWPIMYPPQVDRGYIMTPDDDPAYLYQDVLVGMIPEKELNNGCPSFLMRLISLGRLREGDHAVHIGAGQGYYSAIIAELVGGSGKVTAIEYEAELAARAAANLSPYPHVRVLHGDGSAISLEPADVIYVNAGAVRPASNWLDAMKDGGRLVLPLTASRTNGDANPIPCGAVFLIERKGDDYLAQIRGNTQIYPCIGLRDAASEELLARAFEKGGLEKVTRLYRNQQIEEERCWLRGDGWALAYW